MNDFQWFDVREWGVEGKGWENTNCFYERFPRRAKKMLPELWNMSRHSTGLSCDFETDASCIRAQWKLRLKQLDEPNMTRATFSGLDLYGLDCGTWRWAGQASKHKSHLASDVLADQMKEVSRRFRLYLPLRNPVARIKVGVPHGSMFTPVAPRTAKPIVYYGSSIVHGAYASRAGMVHSSILGRWMDYPVVNLGFSGGARMDEAMAHLLAELDPSVFIIDPLPNMDAVLVKERAEKFLRILCGGHPETPVVLVEDFPQTFAWSRPTLFNAHRDKWKAFSGVYRELRDAGFRHLHYLEGLHSIGDDNIGTIDGIHPNDVGCERLARNLVPTLQQIIQR